MKPRISFFILALLCISCSNEDFKEKQIEISQNRLNQNTAFEKRKEIKSISGFKESEDLKIEKMGLTKEGICWGIVQNLSKDYVIYFNAERVPFGTREDAFTFHFKDRTSLADGIHEIVIVDTIRMKKHTRAINIDFLAKKIRLLNPSKHNSSAIAKKVAQYNNSKEVSIEKMGISSKGFGWGKAKKISKNSVLILSEEVLNSKILEGKFTFTISKNIPDGPHSFTIADTLLKKKYTYFIELSKAKREINLKNMHK